MATLTHTGSACLCSTHLLKSQVASLEVVVAFASAPRLCAKRRSPGRQSYVRHGCGILARPSCHKFHQASSAPALTPERPAVTHHTGDLAGLPDAARILLGELLASKTNLLTSYIRRINSTAAAGRARGGDPATAGEDGANAPATRTLSTNVAMLTHLQLDLGSAGLLVDQFEQMLKWVWDAGRHKGA